MLGYVMYGVGVAFRFLWRIVFRYWRCVVVCGIRMKVIVVCSLGFVLGCCVLFWVGVSFDSGLGVGVVKNE